MLERLVDPLEFGLSREPPVDQLLSQLLPLFVSHLCRVTRPPSEDVFALLLLGRDQHRVAGRAAPFAVLVLERVTMGLAEVLGKACRAERFGATVAADHVAAEPTPAAFLLLAVGVTLEDGGLEDIMALQAASGRARGAAEEVSERCLVGGRMCAWCARAQGWMRRSMDHPILAHVRER